MATSEHSLDFLRIWANASWSVNGVDKLNSDICARRKTTRSDSEPEAATIYGGLLNTGNICFVNSVVQSMASSQPMIEFLNASSSKAASELSLVLTYLNNKGSGSHTHSAVPLLQSLKSSQWSPDTDQQDAHEFFLALIDALKHEASSQTNPDLVIPFEGSLSSSVQCLTCGEEQISKMLPFSSLELSLPSQPSLTGSPLLTNRHNKVTLESMLDAYTGQEILDNVYCQRCSLEAAEAHLNRLIRHTSRSPSPSLLSTAGVSPSTVKPDVSHALRSRLDMIVAALEHHPVVDSTFEKLKPPRLVATQKTKQLMIAVPPQNLVLHVNRSEYDPAQGVASKNNTLVTFPERLAFNKYLSAEGNYEDVYYELLSIIVHFGNHAFGHYITYRRISAKLWLELSDTSVRQVSLADVLSQGNVVMLVYGLKTAKELIVDKEESDVEEEEKRPLYDIHDNADEADCIYSISSPGSDSSNYVSAAEDFDMPAVASEFRSNSVWES